jgi:hypothetical protein
MAHGVSDVVIRLSGTDLTPNAGAGQLIVVVVEAIELAE